MASTGRWPPKTTSVATCTEACRRPLQLLRRILGHLPMHSCPRLKRWISFDLPHEKSQIPHLEARPELPLSRIELLPLELLWCITEHLEADDIACLSYCNRALQQQLRTPLQMKGLQIKGGIGSAREHICDRLARDEPSLFYCFYCEQFHQTSDMASPWRHIHWEIVRVHPRVYEDQPEALRLRQMTLRTPSYGPPGYGHRLCLDYTHVKLILSRHRYGAVYGIALEILAMTEVYEASPEDPYASAHAIDPQIIDDELYLRIQRWVLKPPGHGTYRTGSRPLPIHFSDCRKLDMSVQMEFDHLYAQQESAYYTCVRCGDACHVMFRQWVQGSYATIITCWLRLGRGLHPSDEHWARKVHPRHVCHPYSSIGSGSTQVPTRAALFELHAEKRPFERQADHLQKMMVDRSYQKSFQRIENCLHRPCGWIKPGRFASTQDAV